MNNRLNKDIDLCLLPGYPDSTEETFTSMNSTTLKDGLNKGSTTVEGDEFFASGSPDNIISFQEFVKFTPTNLIGLRIQSSEPSQLQQIIRFYEKSPFHTNEK